MDKALQPGNPPSRFWSRRRRDILLALAFILPSLYIVAKSFVYPVVQSAVWSLYRYNLMEGSPVEFIGAQNYRTILGDTDFWTAMLRTLYFMTVSVGAELLIGFAFALFLNQRFKGRTVLRMLVILPWSLLTLVNGLLWKWIYQPGYGALTVVLHWLHLLRTDENPVWLAKSEGVINFAILADVWKMTPFITLLLLAGLQSIPASLYEAVMIDGGGFWKKLWHITLPQAVPSILVALVLRVIDAFRVYDILTVFTGDPTTSVSYLNFNYSFRYFHLGQASALAWIITAVTLVFILIYIRLLKKSGS